MTTVRKEIPQPQPLPFIGNLKELANDQPVYNLNQLAKKYGEIFKLALPDEELIIISSRDLVNEVCDAKRFDKKVLRPLEELRELAGKGLFTADAADIEWQKAHRILMPAFGPGAIRNMFPEMLDIADQMMLKIEREGSRQSINVSDTMTRLTLDTIALCAFDYRFNSFYKEKMHPFVQAMVEGLQEGNRKATRFEIQKMLMVNARRKHQANIDYMNKIADEIIAERKKNPLQGRQDLLGLMLNAKDPITGEGLSDENIRNQLITFLVAGHETTSGMLSFTIYCLLKNPEALKKAQAEADRVLGNRMPSVKDISQLNYIEQVFKESLRLYPTAPAFALQSFEDTTIGDGFPVKKGQPIIVAVSQLHRDKKVWGNDVESFRPERFERTVFEKMPTNSWKPFGNGQRACIGRPFAMQEAILALAMLLQRFDIEAVDPDYQLFIKETLTVKPEGLEIFAKRRKDVKIVIAHPTSTMQTKEENKTQLLPNAPLIPLTVLYGSNSGSSENFAKKIASEARTNGFASTLGTLNEYANRLPKTGAVIIVTASYEGLPTDNAKNFVARLNSLTDNELTGVKYGVFGCGNRDWIRTYQKVPRMIDQRMQQAGAERIIERGEADARGDFFGDFDSWHESLWDNLQEYFSIKSEITASSDFYKIEVISDPRTGCLNLPNMQSGTIVENRELTNINHPEAASKRHIEIALPAGTNYRAGDYLTVLPSNPQSNVEKALNRFQLNFDTKIIIQKQAEGLSFLPTGFPISVGEILTNYVELAQPATKRQVRQLAETCVCPPHKIKLLMLSKDKKYRLEILEKRISVLDLAIEYAACDIEFSTFLEMLPPLKPRQYSISSSPLRNPNHVSLTVSVVNAPAWSGQGAFKGVASYFLANVEIGSQISVAVQPSSTAFHLPKDISLPIILVGAGSGIAPFRGFLEERGGQKNEEKNIGEAALFFGCRHPEADLIYADEIADYEKSGIVKSYTAFSKKPEGEIKYVQNRIWAERNEIIRLLEKGALIYVCGDGKKMAPAVSDTFTEIYRDWKNCSLSDAENWMDEIKGTRYLTDIFN